MHIADGILPAQVCAAGYAIAGGMTWMALRQIKRTSVPQAEMPKAAMLTAAFFVGSSIRLPIPPTSVHLVLNGLLGTLLGWYAWPAILVGLFLQALLVGHGGLTTLGVNALLIGIPALIAFGVYQLRHLAPQRWSPTLRFGIFAWLAGMVGLGLSALIFVSLMLFTIPTGMDLATERQALMLSLVAHIPVMLIEGGFTMMLGSFIRRINPELVEA